MYDMNTVDSKYFLSFSMTRPFRIASNFMKFMNFSVKYNFTAIFEVGK